MTHWKVGDRVKHSYEGWEGTVLQSNQLGEQQYVLLVQKDDGEEPRPYIPVDLVKIAKKRQ